MVINTASKKWCRVTSIHPEGASIGESSTWTNEKLSLPAAGLHKSSIFQVAAEDRVADINDNGLDRLGVL